MPEYADDVADGGDAHVAQVLLVLMGRVLGQWCHQCTIDPII